MRPQNRNLKRDAGPGRPKGVPNKTSTEVRELARALVEDPAYRKKLRERLLRGKAPQVEVLLYHYAYGKPKETFEHQGSWPTVIIETIDPDKGGY